MIAAIALPWSGCSRRKVDSTTQVSPSSPSPDALPSDAETLTPTVCPSAAVAASLSVLRVLASRVDPHVLADCNAELVACRDVAGVSPSLAGVEVRQTHSTQTRPNPGGACRIEAAAVDTGWHVVVHPRPATGAPAELEAWTDKLGGRASNVRVGLSTWGVAGRVVIRGRTVRATHDHGGPPARIGLALFEVHNKQNEPMTLTLQRTQWLHGRATPLVPRGLTLDLAGRSPRMSLSIPPGVHDLLVLHEPLLGHARSVNESGTAATFELDGETVEVVAEHRISSRRRHSKQ